LGAGSLRRAASARHHASSLSPAALHRGCLILCSVAVAATAPAFAASSVPLPPDVQVVAPAKEIPPEIAGFSGKWEGKWDDRLEHILVVERINPPTAGVIYAYGEAPSWGVKVGSFLRPDARVEPCTLTLTLPRPATVTYRMEKDGTLDATYESAHGISSATLKRVDVAGNASAPATGAMNCPSMDAAINISKLPTHLKGHYRFTSTIDFKLYDLQTELEIASQDSYGNVVGRYTVWLPWGSRPESMCYASNQVPMTGRYDGKTLSLVIKSSNNGPGCRDSRLILTRGKDHYLERRYSDATSSWYYDAAE
jgi:hypothetical protein